MRISTDSMHGLTITMARRGGAGSADDRAMITHDKSVIQNLSAFTASTELACREKCKLALNVCHGGLL